MLALLPSLAFRRFRSRALPDPLWKGRSRGPAASSPTTFPSSPPQQTIALRRCSAGWTPARTQVLPRTTEVEYVNFTGNTNAGNNTSHVGFKPGERTDINITAFWWRELEWMPAHELGHALGFFHEHQRWDRDQFITVHYENIKPGRAHDYDRIAKTNWLVPSLPYDYRSIMHYRVCWASAGEEMPGRQRQQPLCRAGARGQKIRPRHRPMDGQPHQPARCGKGAAGLWHQFSRARRRVSLPRLGVYGCPDHWL